MFVSLKTGCQYVAKAGLKLMILPVLLPEGWDHKLTGTAKDVSPTGASGSGRTSRLH